MKKSFSVYRMGKSPLAKLVSPDHKSEAAAIKWAKENVIGVFTILPIFTIEAKSTTRKLQLTTKPVKVKSQKVKVKKAVPKKVAAKKKVIKKITKKKK
jgi:hypothetical protein